MADIPSSERIYATPQQRTIIKNLFLAEDAGNWSKSHKRVRSREILKIPQLENLNVEHIRRRHRFFIAEIALRQMFGRKFAQVTHDMTLLLGDGEGGQQLPFALRTVIEVLSNVYEMTASSTVTWPFPRFMGLLERCRQAYLNRLGHRPNFQSCAPLTKDDIEILLCFAYFIAKYILVSYRDCWTEFSVVSEQKPQQFTKKDRPDRPPCC